jgi:hypothetical protein
MLQKDPKHRMTIDEVLNDEFFALPIPDTLPTTLLGCPPNAHFLAKYQHPTPELKHKDSIDVQLSLKHKDSNDSHLHKTDRVLDKGDSTRNLVRTNSTEQLNKNLYAQRAASSAALSRGRLASSNKQDHPKLVPSLQPIPHGPYIWVTYF